jgi:phosphoribosyl-AMP cyclohydrolase
MTAPSAPPAPAWLSDIQFDAQGLVPAIAQDAATGRILMMAWMNAEAILETARTGQAVYFSRSRGRLWRKGEESGNTQAVQEIRLDCDGDVLLLQVVQTGGIACHTGRESCFFRRLDAADGTHAWTVRDPVLKDPRDLYDHPGHTH